MNLASYAKGSSYALQRWRDADSELSRWGFSEDDRQAILRAASRNRLNPVSFAKNAIRLRRHVRAGSPLS